MICYIKRNIYFTCTIYCYLQKRCLHRIAVTMSCSCSMRYKTFMNWVMTLAQISSFCTVMQTSLMAPILQGFTPPRCNKTWRKRDLSGLYKLCFFTFHHKIVRPYLGIRCVLLIWELPQTWYYFG